jgi:ATPase subunit of ABC transporter with duplicated ATPase domains
VSALQPLPLTWSSVSLRDPTSVSNVGISFGADELFKNVTFTVAEGERWGIIGRNGAGKTSIFNVITGDLQPTVGSVARKPGLRHALLDQHRAFEGATTVWQADSTRRRGGMNGRTSRMNAPSAMSSMSVRAPSPAWRSSTT